MERSEGSVVVEVKKTRRKTYLRGIEENGKEDSIEITLATNSRERSALRVADSRSFATCLQELKK